MTGRGKIAYRNRVAAVMDRTPERFRTTPEPKPVKTDVVHATDMVAGNPTILCGQPWMRVTSSSIPADVTCLLCRRILRRRAGR